METKEFTKIEHIPYCGDINIEGFWNEDFTKIKSYYGGWSPLGSINDPHYFRATWVQSQHGRHGEYRDSFDW